VNGDVFIAIALVKALLSGDPSSSLQYSEEFTGDAAAFFDACGKHGLEGIVSKRADAPYRSGRTKTWLKTKCFTESEFILLGIDRDRKSGAPRAILAEAVEGNLVYAGAAFLALRSAARETLAATWTNSHRSVHRLPGCGTAMRGGYARKLWSR
jgi:ATP-dependent DNA ligase